MPDAGADPTVSSLRLFLAEALLAVVIPTFVLAALWLLRPDRRPLFPPSRRARTLPWTGAEILLTLLLMHVVPASAFAALDLAGFFRWQYGAAAIMDETLTPMRAALWASIVGGPLAVAAILASVRFASGTKLRHLGLTRWRWLPALAAGFLGWLLVAPPTFGLHLVLVWGLKQVGLEPKKHAFEQILENQARPVEWVIIVLLAVIVAPVLEELVFRGLLQPWLMKRRAGGLVAWIGALIVAMLHGGRDPASWLPTLFVLLVGAAVGLLTAAGRPPRYRWSAIAGTSALFAAFHTDTWPAPVALFFLSLALGWLVDRSKSLIPAITMHSLFNSVATLALLMDWVKD